MGSSFAERDGKESADARLKTAYAHRRSKVYGERTVREEITRLSLLLLRTSLDTTSAPYCTVYTVRSVFVVTERMEAVFQSRPGGTSMDVGPGLSYRCSTPNEIELNRRRRSLADAYCDVGCFQRRRSRRKKRECPALPSPAQPCPHRINWSDPAPTPPDDHTQSVNNARRRLSYEDDNHSN